MLHVPATPPEAEDCTPARQTEAPWLAVLLPSEAGPSTACRSGSGDVCCARSFEMDGIVFESGYWLSEAVRSGLGCPFARR